MKGLTNTVFGRDIGLLSHHMSYGMKSLLLRARTMMTMIMLILVSIAILPKKTIVN